MQNNPDQSQKIIVAHLITGLDSGGAQMMLYNLLSKTNREKFEPIVISMMDRGIFADRIATLDVPIYTLDMNAETSSSIKSLWKLQDILRQLKPNVIQSWMYHANIAAALSQVLSFMKIPVCWGIHHSIASLSSEKKLTITLIKLGAYLSRLPSKIVFVSQSSQQQHQALGYSDRHSDVIPNGFDTSLFMPSPTAKLALRSELGLPENAFLIGAIGRNHPMKDHANFIQAAALLHAQQPEIHFLLIGKELNGNNLTLVEQIKKLNIKDHFHLLGERNDISRLTAALDICSLSSAYGEAFPLVIGEAMSCGVPCVVTDVGDSGWIVGDTGRVVPPKNAPALAAAWQELVELDPQAREELGKMARKRVIEDFSLELIVDRYEEVYASLA
jgi:glycosyltransferase involved in cell wall biosynthesis